MAEGFFNIAHRGGADLWPENTLPAFAAAIELGVDGIEFDLHLSQDGHLIVHHDLRLKADATRLNSAYITPPTPQIGELTRAELAKYDVGRLDPNSDYARRRPDQTPIDGAPIPDFSALCALIRDRAPAGFRLYAELKTALGDNADPAHMLADSFIDAIETSGLTAQSSVISFDWRCVNRVRAALPDIAHAFTTMPFERTDPKAALNPDDPKIFALVKQASAKGAPWWDDFDWREMDGDSHADKVLNAILAAKAKGWFGHWTDIDAPRMAWAQDHQLAVSAWTVNETATMRQLADWGVAAIITDRPDLCREVQQERAARV